MLNNEMTDKFLESLPFINEEQIKSALKWGPLIDAVERAMIDFSAGKVAQPVRQIVQVPGHNAVMSAMPAVGEAMAVKVFTIYHDNAGTNVPTHQAVILLFDIKNGSPLAVLDGRLITEMRTAAGSAAVARKLAKNKQAVVTIMGSGVQAYSHAKALAEVIEIGELRVWSRNETRGKSLVEKLGVGAKYMSDAEQAVKDSDIIVCATSAKEPILKGAWLKPGSFVAAVGWNTVDGRELDDDAMVDNTVLVESYEAARNQAGNIRGSGCEIFAEVGEIYSGAKKAPEGSTVIYDSVGVAIMDVVAAKLAYDLVLG